MICYFQEAKDYKAWLWHVCAAAVCCAAHISGKNNLNVSESMRQVPIHYTPDAIYILQAKLLYKKLASVDVSQPEIQS